MKRKDSLGIFGKLTLAEAENIMNKP